jgi:excisionase family DNA binding protein
MNNPFEVIEARLSDIESLILDLKQPKQEHPPTKQSEQFLNVRETAKFLKLADSTIYSKVSKGELPVMKRGKRLYFSTSELMQYIKEGRKKSNAQIEAEAQAYLSNNIKGLK